MNKYTEKLIKAKELIEEAEKELLEEKKSCPYEIGFTLRKLEEAIDILEEAK